EIILTNLGTSNELEWSDQSDNELGFIIERSLTSENNFELVDTLANNTVKFTDELGSDANLYTYRIKAYNDGGESTYTFVGQIILNANDLLFKKLKIYPNPVIETVTIELPEFSGESTIRIYNLLKQDILSTRKANQSLEIDLSGYPAGIYIVEIRNRLGTTIRKICKQQ
ncbi:MAG: T9SS type A sorting domain-containing protein, partial [Cyclobacteriaceae bacterium]|nr:T9SS type A sorting domain-containing protein [Cyclobacteriaceae bacterium]